MKPDSRPITGSSVAAVLRRELGAGMTLRALGASGFCATWRAEAADARWFVKSAPAASRDLLAAEADGLAALAATATVRVPAAAGPWCSDDGSLHVLVIEWLDFVAADAGFGARLGHALAGLHGAPCPMQPARYGWPRDNHIGATVQTNQPSTAATTADWIGFVARQRLGAMRARLALDAHLQPLCSAVDAAIDALPALFDDGHRPHASLIHGDLWSGNWGMLADGTPVVFDPAVSCADPEAELAMMQLFGAPPAGFWNAYRERAGVHAGYARRRPAYQLYHLLNHVVLFGGSYVASAIATAQAVVRNA